MPAKKTATESRIARIAASSARGDARRVEDYIKRLVDEAPPLTNEQRDRLAILLRRSR